jgi:hypothetical protein
MSYPRTPVNISLPYGIEIFADGNRSRLTSRLGSELEIPLAPFDPAAVSAVHAVESVLLALAGAGVDLSHPGAGLAIFEAVQSIAEFLCSVPEDSVKCPPFADGPCAVADGHALMNYYQWTSCYLEPTCSVRHDFAKPILKVNPHAKKYINYFVLAAGPVCIEFVAMKKCI